MAKSNRVLIVCSREDSREVAYEIMNHLEEYGYSSCLCNHTDEEIESDVKASVSLSEDTIVADYDAVVFLDDGNDPDNATRLAEKADEAGLVIGGYGPGLLPVREAGALEGHKVCSGVEVKGYDESKKRAEEVDAPAVRNGNVVTARGDCPLGFSILLVDALGGKVKNIVKSDSSTVDNAALIIAPTSRWARYWGLAIEMEKSGASVILAEWDSIDTDSESIRSALHINPSQRDVKGLKDHPIPKNIWFQEPSMSADEMSDAISEMERIGCVSVNSSGAVSAMHSEEALVLAAAVAGEELRFHSPDEVDDVLSGTEEGVLELLTTDDSLRVSCRGDRVVVSSSDRNLLSTPDTAAEKAKKALRGRRFAARKVVTADRRVSLTWRMINPGEGWRVTDRYAQTIDMSGDAVSVLRVVLPDEYEAILQDGDALAEMIGAVIRSLVGDEGSLGEMNIAFKLTGKEMSIGGIFSTVQDDEVTDHSKMASILAPRVRNDIYERIVERELAHEGIWLQPDGTIAMRTDDGIDRVPDMESLVDRLKDEAVSAVEEEIDCLKEGRDPSVKSKKSRWARHRLRAAIEMMQVLGGKTRMAGVYPSGVAGPYAHLELPMHERVFEWREGDDWLTDREESISNLPRYNPEYIKTSPDDSAGFFAVWPEEARGPTDWLEFLKGNSVYKTRNLLAPGRLY